MPFLVPFLRLRHSSPSHCECWQLMVHKEQRGPSLENCLWRNESPAWVLTRAPRHPAQQPMTDGHGGTQSWSPCSRGSDPVAQLVRAGNGRGLLGSHPIFPSLSYFPAPRSFLLSSLDQSHASHQALLVENLAQGIQPTFNRLYDANFEWNSLPRSLDLLGLQNLRSQTHQSPRLF